MDKNQLFGGNPTGVIIRLVVLSVVVGIVLQALNIAPQHVFYYLQLLMRRIYELGFGVFESVFGYFLIGAVIVIPVWLLTRLLGGLAGRGNNRQP